MQFQIQNQIANLIEQDIRWTATNEHASRNRDVLTITIMKITFKFCSNFRADFSFRPDSPPFILFLFRLLI